MLEVPNGSIYFWMYTQGLKHVPTQDIVDACATAGTSIRKKDWDNYYNGFYRSDLRDAYDKNVFVLSRALREPASSLNYFDMAYHDYPDHPYLGMPEIENRFVPCSSHNKPMIKWGEGCMSKEDAQAYVKQRYLAENLKGCKFIVVDCDGDHDEVLDMEAISFFSSFIHQTHTLMKPKHIYEYKGYEDTGIEQCASFHLTFAVDKVIPTMHFPYAHIDIVGNKMNSLRYFKNKVWNNLPPLQMNDEIWEKIKSFIAYKKEEEYAKDKPARPAQ